MQPIAPASVPVGGGAANASTSLANVAETDLGKNPSLPKRLAIKAWESLGPTMPSNVTESEFLKTFQELYVEESEKVEKGAASHPMIAYYVMNGHHAEDITSNDQLVAKVKMRLIRKGGEYQHHLTTLEDFKIWADDIEDVLELRCSASVARAWRDWVKKQESVAYDWRRVGRPFITALLQGSHGRIDMSELRSI